jgi:hypothetical protein
LAAFDLSPFLNMGTTPTREAYNDYVTNIISPEQTNNPKRFWSFIKSKKQDNSGIASLRAKAGIIYSDNNNKAEILKLEEKSSLFFNHSIGYFSIWMWIVYCTLTVNMKI